MKCWKSPCAIEHSGIPAYSFLKLVLKRKRWFNWITFHTNLWRVYQNAISVSKWFLPFLRLPPFSSTRRLWISPCYSTPSDQSLWFHSFKSSLFQRVIAVRGSVNRDLNWSFSTAGSLLHVTRQQHQWRRAGVSELESQEESGSQIHITYESHLTPTGRNNRPWRKGNSRLQALGELLGDREAQYGRWDEQIAGVLSQMALTDT